MKKEMKRNLINFCFFGVLMAILSIAANSQQSFKPNKTMQSTNDKQPNQSREAANFDELIDCYFDSLNETDFERRRQIIKQAWAKDPTFVSPVGKAESHNAIEAQIEGFQKQFPKAEVRRTSEIEVLENDYIRFAFEAADADGKVFIRGVDFAVVRNGKLQSVVGFFDLAPTRTNQERKAESLRNVMSKENINVVNQIYNAFNKGDFTAVLEFFDSSIEWIAADSSPLADQSPYRGLNVVRDKVLAQIAVRSPELKIRVEEIFAVEDKVVMLGYYHNFPQTLGATFQVQVAHVWTISKGKAVKFQQYMDTYKLAAPATR
jgi:ketosteroid isomerase-like protein